ncbi:MAG: hypothetical protein ACLR7D_04435 [Lachnospira eligens]
MTNFNYDNYDDDTKAKYDDGIEFLDDDFSLMKMMMITFMIFLVTAMSLLLHIIIKKSRKLLDRKY